MCARVPVCACLRGCRGARVARRRGPPRKIGDSSARAANAATCAGRRSAGATAAHAHGFGRDNPARVVRVLAGSASPILPAPALDDDALTPDHARMHPHTYAYTSLGRVQAPPSLQRLVTPPRSRPPPAARPSRPRGPLSTTRNQVERSRPVEPLPPAVTRASESRCDPAPPAGGPKPGRARVYAGGRRHSPSHLCAGALSGMARGPGGTPGGPVTPAGSSPSRAYPERAGTDRQESAPGRRG